MITEDAIVDHARTIDALRDVSPKSIVLILRHGWLPENDLFYFVDMELCSYNLEQYIQTGNTDLMHCIAPGEEALNFRKRLTNTLLIALQIVKGLVAIHASNKVHKDLKPSNGNFFFVF